MFLTLPAFTCGGGMYSFDAYHNIFNQSSIVDASYQEYYLKTDYYSHDESLESVEARNVLDWKEYLGGNLSYKEVEYLLQNTSLSKAELPKKYSHLLNDKFDEFWKFQKLANALDGKVYVTYDDVWEGNTGEKKKKDLTEIKEKMEHQLEISSPYFKKRYAYQLIKIANIQKRYNEVNQLYATYFSRGAFHQAIDYYALDKQARYLNKNKQDSIQAAYSYLQVFLSVPEKRESAFNSLAFSLDVESMYLMKPLLRNKQDQLAYYFIYGYRTLEPPINYLEKMVDIDPDSELTHLALARTLDAVNRIESPRKYYHQTVFACNDFEKDNYSRFVYEPNEIHFIQESANMNRLTSIINRVLRNNEVKDKGVWQYAKAQNCLFDGCFLDAEYELSKIKSGSKIDYEKEILSTLLKLNGLTKIGNKEEKMLYPLLKKIEEIEKGKRRYNRDLSEYFYLNLAKKYVQSGQIGKAFLSINTEHALSHNRKLCILDKLSNLFAKNDKTELEQYLVNRFSSKYPKYALLDHYVSYYMMDMDLKMALEYIEKIERASMEIKKTIPNYYNLDENIFNAFIENCFSCSRVNGALPKGLKMNIPSIKSKYDLVKFLVQLDSEKKQNPEAAYLLANFYLNSSKHKHYRYLYSNTGKGMASSRLFFKHDAEIDDYIDIPIQNDKIKALYELVLNSSTNSELVSAAQWGITEIALNEKIEKNSKDSYYILEDIIEQREMEFAYRKMEKYKDTDFYKEAIKECTLFENY